MLIALTTVWLVGLVVSYADARLPPKFLKATNNVGKIYAGRYGYSLVPTAPKFLVQASVDRKVVHVPVLRPVRKKRRPLGRRPPLGPPEYGFNDYPAAASKKYPRLRKPPKYRSKPRPPPREPEYYEQEVEDEPEDFNDYEYDEKRQEKQKRYEDRPLKRGYSSSSSSSSIFKAPYEESRPKPFSDSRYKRPYEEEEEFLAQHSELYASGINSGKPKSRPTRTKDDDEPPRRYKPFNKGPKGPGPTRPTNKLYSASFPPARRPAYPREEERYRYEEEEEEEVIQRPRYKKRPRYPEEDYDDIPQEKEESKESLIYHPGGPPEEFEYNPDSFYHDRKFEPNEPKQKAKRGTEDKDNGGSKPRQRRPSENKEDLRPFAPSESSGDRRRPERKEPQSRRNKDKTRVKPDESQEAQKQSKKSKWSIPYRLEDEEEEWDHRGTVTSEKPPKQQDKIQNLVTIRPKTTEEKPVNEHVSAQASWPVIVQGINWNDAPNPAFVENHPTGFMSDWQNFKIPQWPNMDEQLGQFPESLRSTFKWVEPTNQTPLHPTVTPPNHRTTTQSPIVIPPVDYPARGTGSSNNESRKKKSSKRGQKDRTRDGNSDIVAQRVVGGTLQLNAGAFKPDQTHAESWVNPAFRSSSKSPGRSPQQQYTVEMFKSVEPGKPFEGEIVYGTRISDNKSKMSSIEPDIGYHSGMETVEDDIGGWQVY